MNHGLLLLNVIKPANNYFCFKKNFEVYDGLSFKYQSGEEYDMCLTPVDRIGWSFGSPGTNKKPLDKPDFSEPKESDYDKDGNPLLSPLENSSAVMTIEQAVKTISKVNPSFPPIDLDPIVARKQITCVGLEQIAPDIFLRSIAQIYSYKVNKKNKRWEISSQIQNLDGNKHSVYEELKLITPRNVLCFLDKSYNVDKNSKNDFLKGKIKINERKNYTADVKRHRVRRIRVELQPKLKDKTKILLQDTSLLTQSTIGFLFAIDSFPRLYNFINMSIIDAEMERTLRLKDPKMEKIITLTHNARDSHGYPGESLYYAESFESPRYSGDTQRFSVLFSKTKAP
jgi:hypothetical protein